MRAEAGSGGALAAEHLVVLRKRVEELGDRLLDSQVKGLALAAGDSLAASDVLARNWNLLAGDLDFPALVLNERELTNNIDVMAAYCRERGVELAPHGKTTMAPQLFLRQLESRAWGITAATAWQVRVMRSFGVPRILMANELVDPWAIGWVLDELEAAQGGAAAPFDFLCYVDSTAGIEIIERVVAARGSGTRLPVLVELGYAEGRSGSRSVPEALAIAERAAASPGVRLRGVSAFEGLVPGASLEETLAAIQRYLDDVHELAVAVEVGGLCGSEPIVVSSGGSAYFDLVADTLGPGAFDFPVQTILRSGCYVTHDAEMYEDTSILGHRPGTGRGLLRPALELWATVWSRPRPDLAIVGFGKRDCPYDYRLPVPLRTRRPGETTWSEVQGSFEVTHLNDQHAFVRIPPASTLAVGDQVVSGISHPCGAFDKWNYIPVVDDDYTVTDGIFTFF
jgi:D-serine dehydratase